MAEEEQVQSSTEETTEAEEETAQTEETESSEETSEQATDTEGKHKKAFEDQKKRAEKAEAELKKLKADRQETSRAPKKDDQVAALEQRTAAAEQRAVRAELTAAGYKHPDDQKYLLDAAKRLGVEPLEAANDELVAGKLKRMAETRATKDATPPPTGRGGSQSGGNIGSLADKAERGDALPTDPDLKAKVQEELRKRAKNRS